MPRLITLLFVMATALGCHAQDGGELLEYQQEIGGGIGLDSYVGDAAGGFMKHPGLMGTVLWRRNLNPRMVVKVNASFGHISGNTEGIYIPQDPLSETPEGGQKAELIHFSRNILDFGAQFEFNFLGYGMGASFKGLKRWTPYLTAGVGMCIGMGGGAKAAAGMCIPLGAGFRFKFKPRWNLGFEWTFNFTTTDKLDDSEATPHLIDPYGIESGMFKNKDCYTKMALTVSYDIAPKYRKCNN